MARQGESLYTLPNLPGRLPKTAAVFIDKKMDGERATQAALGWALGCYASANTRRQEKRICRACLPTRLTKKQLRRG